MPLILPGNVASATAATGYSIANSCRFDGSSSYMTFTLGSETNRDRWTWSCWVKKCIIGVEKDIMNIPTDDDNAQFFKFTSDALRHDTVVGNATVGRLQTNRKFRDPSAWYHLVIVWDSANGTAGNRMRMYVNGVEETSFSTDTNPSSGQDSWFYSGKVVNIGRDGRGTGFFDGYMAEIVFCDGQAYAASDFGEFDEDSPTIWQPKDVSELTFGNNGFWLDFEDSSALGNDVSGNNNDFGVTNLAAVDQATDTPTNNFCVMNPLANKVAGGVFSQGNTIVTSPAGNYAPLTGTIGLTKGKWYFEMVETAHTGTQFLTGIAGDMAQRQGASTSHALGETAYQYGLYAEQGTIHTSSEYSSYDSGLTPVVDEIVSCYLDLDNNKIYFSEKGGSIANSGTGFSITASASVPDGVYFAAACYYSGTEGVIAVNFGGSSGFAISSGNTDANGYGNFEYSPNDGGGSSFDGAAKNFLAICTKNLGSDGG